MKFNFKHLVAVSASVLPFYLGASPASTQYAKFNLPVEARWGNVVLAPGEYSLEAPDSRGGAQVFYLRSNSGAKIIAPSIVDSEPTSGPSCLRLVNISGTYYVEEYDPPSKNVAIKFAVPRPNRELTASERVLVPSN
jgi:hypothetical protein